MASKSDFIRTLTRLTFVNDDVQLAAVADQAAAQWADLKPAQRAALVHDDARCRIFAAGYAAGYGGGYAADQADAKAASPAAHWLAGKHGEAPHA